MKKIVFIIFYDNISYGARLLSSIAKEAGLESHIILFKKETGYVPLFRKKKNKYQFFFNGLLRDGDYAVDKIKEKEIQILLDKLEELSPSLLCLSTMTFGYEFCRDIFLRIKERLPLIPILSGGWGPTLEPEKFLEFSDYVSILEGEKAIQYICEAIKDGKDFNNAPNLIYYKDGMLIRNPVVPALSVKEMNNLPFSDFHVENKYLITDSRILLGSDFYNKKIYDCFASRGCPSYCSYCMMSKYDKLYKNHSGSVCSKLRLRDVGVVLEEVYRAKERGAEFIRFKDDIFPFNPKWIDEFLDRYPKEIGLPFFSYLYPQFHKPEIIRKLKVAGLIMTMHGIQSGSEEIRKKIYNRIEPKDKAIKFAHTLNDLDIQFSYHFIYRNPFECEHHLQESLEFTFQLPYRNVFVFKLLLFPGLPLSRMVDEHNPQPLPVNIADWYAILHSMSLKGPIYRYLAKFIYKRNLFRKFPNIMSLFFVFPLCKEFRIRLMNKYIFKTGTYFLLKKKRGKENGH